MTAKTSTTKKPKTEKGVRKASQALRRTTRKPKTGAMAAILETAGDLERAGLISKKTMRDYEERNSPTKAVLA